MYRQEPHRVLQGALLTLLALGAPLAPAAPEVTLRDFTVTKVAEVAPGATLLACRDVQDKTIFHVASGSSVLFLEAGRPPMTYASLPEPIVRLTKVATPSHRGLFALTARGNGFLIDPAGTARRIINGDLTLPVQVAFPVLPLYAGTPIAVVHERGYRYVARPSAAPEENAPLNAPVIFDTKLAPLSIALTALVEYNVPQHRGLVGLTSKGQLLRLTPQGTAELWALSRKLEKARHAVADTFGLFGRALIVSVPSEGQLYAVSPDKKLELLVKGLDTTVSSQGAVAMNARGTLFVLAGNQILSIAPVPDSDLATGAAGYREALTLYASEAWEKAQQAARTAAKGLKEPREFVRQILSLALAAQGAPLLERARKAADEYGPARLLKQARQLETTYGATRLGTDLAVFRKQCEIASTTLILNDFEDRSAHPQGMSPAKVEPAASTVCRATAPEPVAEGMYSLRWDIPGRTAEIPTLKISGMNWGHTDQILTMAIRIHSPRARVGVMITCLNGQNVELARYPLTLKKGWQQLVKPPLRVGPFYHPQDLTLQTLIIEKVSDGPVRLYLDDLRLSTVKKKQS